MQFIREIRNSIVDSWENHPLRLILLLAVVTRLIAVLFAKGFGWFDDHFLIIEASQSWVDGYDYNKWLPGTEGNAGPTGHNLFYTGLHYLFFKFCSLIGFDSPQGKMYVVRALHAALSLLIGTIGYKITLFLDRKETARFVGLFLAILWIFPFVSVRNLVEFTCVPFLMWGTWILMKGKEGENKWIQGFWAGLILGLAFSMRFQSLIYIGGIGLGLIILGRWKEAMMAAVGIITTAFICLGTIDMYLWGYPFAELAEYVRYNMYNYGEYITGPWYQYLLVILGILVPPISIYLFFGFFYAFYSSWKKYLLIFLPVFIFLAFHSYFPNKQERFILPIIPFIIILGGIGWSIYLRRSVFWKKRKKLMNGSMVFFWVINFILLAVITTTYSKRSRVESMTYLSRYKGIKEILVENTNQYNVNLLPKYYLGQWPEQREVSKSRPLDQMPEWIVDNDDHHPDFVIFEGKENIDKRVAELKAYFPEMVYETTVSPGLIDRILFWLNPINENQNAYIYRNTKHYPEKIGNP